MEMGAIFFLSLGLLTILGCSSPVHGITNDTGLYVALKDCGRNIYNNSHDTPERIIGGRFAKPGEYPWMVSLRKRNSEGFEHECGAAIINKNWIVTAAHCFESTSTRDYDVVVGLHKLSEVNNSTTAKIHKLSKIILHAGFDPDTNIDDIALVKTSRPIDFKASRGYIAPVCLPKPGSDPTGEATVTGWGLTAIFGELSDTLKTVDVPIVPRKTCNDRYDDDPSDNTDEIVETMICAGSQGRDACQNDSGGPLVQYDAKGRATLIGIVSFGIGCGLAEYPGVYTRVSSYLRWIKARAI